jgi:hypothetical protein
VRDRERFEGSVISIFTDVCMAGNVPPLMVTREQGGCCDSQLAITVTNT